LNRDDASGWVPLLYPTACVIANFLLVTIRSPLVDCLVAFDNRMMNPTVRTLLAGLLLLMFAGGLARVSQLLAPHLPWPLLAVFIGGGLGTGAAVIWEQRWIKSWTTMIGLCLLAIVSLSVAEHYFAWQNQIAIQEAAWLKSIREEPKLAGIPSPFNPPTWAEFMSGGEDPVRTWAWWLFDASAKGLVALTVLHFRKGRSMQDSPPTELAA
jgi:hypothetical protein